MFTKEKTDEIKDKVKEINKMKLQEDRLHGLISYRASIHCQINDELDELFSLVNLKKSKEE